MLNYPVLPLNVVHLSALIHHSLVEVIACIHAVQLPTDTIMLSEIKNGLWDISDLALQSSLLADGEKMALPARRFEQVRPRALSSLPSFETQSRRFVQDIPSCTFQKQL